MEYKLERKKCRYWDFSYIYIHQLRFGCNIIKLEKVINGVAAVRQRTFHGGVFLFIDRSSTSRNSGNLDPVVEVFQEADTDYKLSRPQQQNLAYDQGNNEVINFYFAITAIIYIEFCFFIQ